MVIISAVHLIHNHSTTTAMYVPFPIQLH